MQPARPDSVLARLVFVNLLKCNSQGVAKLCLIHVEHQAAHADSAADVFINWFREFSSGHETVAASYGITAKSSRHSLDRRIASVPILSRRVYRGNRTRQ